MPFTVTNDGNGTTVRGDVSGVLIYGRNGRRIVEKDGRVLASLRAGETYSSDQPSEPRRAISIRWLIDLLLGALARVWAIFGIGVRRSQIGGVTQVAQVGHGAHNIQIGGSASGITQVVRVDDDGAQSIQIGGSASSITQVSQRRGRTQLVQVEGDNFASIVQSN